MLSELQRAIKGCTINCGQNDNKDVEKYTRFNFLSDIKLYKVSLEPKTSSETASLIAQLVKNLPAMKETPV